MRLAAHKIFRTSTTDETSTPKGESCSESPNPKETTPCKTESSAPPPPPPPPPSSACREPQPCPPMPLCPPTLCPPVPDPNNPCNYRRPECIDPDYPDLTRLKKLQCKFQEDNGIPIHLKGGKFDVFLFQLTVVLTVVGCVSSLYSTLKLILK